MPDSKEALYTYSFTDGTWVRPVEGRLLYGSLCLPVISVVSGVGYALAGRYDDAFLFALMTLVCYAMVRREVRRSKLQHTPCELQFYDKYFVVYYPRRYYSKRKIRREFYMMEYVGIRDVRYNKGRNRIEFTGCIKSGYISYDKLDRLVGDCVNYDVHEGDLFLQTKFAGEGLAKCLADHLKIGGKNCHE